jgi:hypothetical protein
MARGLHQLILLSACAALGIPANAETPATPEKKPRKERAETASPEFENVRKALDALTPEQRKRFQENFWRWANLPTEEKKALRNREETRKKFMEQDVQAAIQESALQLDGERRAQFVQRYGEERRKIEEQLRKETMEKRKPLIREMVARLKAEFSETGPTPVEPTPASAKQP